jgi:hypothetical protein
VRQAWLDFGGGGFTFRDTLTGHLRSDGRLEMATQVGPSQLTLGRVQVGGQDRLITRMAAGGAGVEIHSSEIHAIAALRSEGSTSRLPAAGWRHEIGAAEMELNLPPGWHLLAATGADEVRDTWSASWTLLHVFAWLIGCLMIMRLFGWPAGMLAFFALGLSLAERGAPALLWLVVVAAECAGRWMRNGRAGTVVRAGRVLAWVALLVTLIPYAWDTAQEGLFPGRAVSPSWSDRYSTQVQPPGEEEGETPSFLRRNEEQFRGTAGSDHVLADDPLVGSVPTGPDVGGRRHKGSLAEMSARPTLDPTAQVQTGPGIPSWRGETAVLTWQQPVAWDHEVRLYLMPPAVSSVLAFLRLGLLATLVFFLLRREMQLGSYRLAPQPLVKGLLVLALAFALGFGGRASTAAASELPSAEMLDDLHDHLLQAPTCGQHCASLERLRLEIVGKTLRVRATFTAAALTDVPLPAAGPGWMPETVLIEGRPASSLAHGDDVLRVVVEPGVSRVELVGTLPSRSSVELPLPMHTGDISSTTPGWRLDGGEKGSQATALRLSREASGGQRTDDDVVLSPFVKVERRLRLGLQWELSTTVERAFGGKGAFVLELPLLSDESVTTSNVHVDVARRRVIVAFGPHEDVVSWQSTLSERSLLTLVAEPVAAAFATEQWTVEATPIWHVTFEGLAPVQPSRPTAAPMWRPWPGEEVRVHVTRPPSAGGATVTVDQGELRLSPGPGETRGRLTLHVRAGHAGEQVFRLPAGVVIEKTAVDGQELRQAATPERVVVALKPGPQEVELVFRDRAHPLSVAYRGPAVDLGLPVVNATVVIEGVRPRWLLWLTGPGLGPHVNGWIVAAALLLLAWALARSRLTPLGPLAWGLLLLGGASLDVSVTGMVVVFLLWLGLRSRRPSFTSAWLYDAAQIAWAAAALVALASLCYLVKAGLVAHPDLGVSDGDGMRAPSAADLSWYQDRVSNAWPQPLVVSLPVLAYRGLAFLWTCWLGVALSVWAPWAWRIVTAGGLWRPISRPFFRPVVAPPVPSPPSAASPESPEGSPKAEP